MNKKFFAVVLAALVTVIFAGCSKKGGGLAGGVNAKKTFYSTFTSAESDFSVDVPEAYRDMKLNVTPADTGSGQPELKTYVAEDKEGVYAVNVSVNTDFGKLPADKLKTVLEDSAKGMLGDKAPLLKEETTIAGFHGLRLRLNQKTEKGVDVFMEVRSTIIGDSMYQLLAVKYDKAGLDTDEVSRFFDSFKYTGDAKPHAEAK